MIILENLNQLPKENKYRLVASTNIVDGCDYAYYHAAKKFYSCFFNLTEKKKGV